MNQLKPIVNTTLGQVQGHILKTVYGDEYFCFDGIPYAQPPLGELRFRSPVEAKPWTGLKDCTQIANKCIQYNKYTKQIEGSEDCLYVNVYAKKLVSEKKLPVLVYIHGGGFATGDASRKALGPDYFMMKDVILVTIGFRLGALGFLSLGDKNLHIPGNAGLKDIVLALKWLKRNIDNFNGDSKNVTLFGHSSGSSAIELLLLTEQAKGLIDKAILMSGYQMSCDSTSNLVHRFAKHLGFIGRQNDTEIYEYLSRIDAEKLCILDFWTPEEKLTGYLDGYIFSPTIETYKSHDAILLDYPVNLIATSWGARSVPVMMGCNADESCYYYKIFKGNEKSYELYKSRPEFLIWSTLSSLDVDLNAKRTAARKVRKVHYGAKPYALENFECTLDVIAYNFMYYNVSRYLRARVSSPENAPTYLYHFAFDSETFNFHRIKIAGRDMRGAGHVAELPYLFWMPETFELQRDSPEFRNILRMMDIWTGFAATSNPKVECTKNLQWEPFKDVELNHCKCLNINLDISLIDWPYAEKCKAMDEAYKEIGLKIY